MEKIVEKYLGLTGSNITKVEIGTQNEVYNVNNKYLIKVFSKDAISNEYQRKIRENKEKVAEIANNNGINAILPYKFNNKYIQKMGNYFVIYPFVKYVSITKAELLNRHVENLAKAVSKLHSINTDVDLPKNNRKKFNLNLDKYIFYHINNIELRTILVNNMENIKNIESRINNALDNLKGKSVISHNDLKLANILWDGFIPYFVDWDATGYINHMCAANEYAYFLASNKGKLNIEHYRIFMKNYLEHHKCTDNIYDVIYMTLYGKFSWFQYSLERSTYSDENEAKKGIEAIKSLIKEFVNYEKNIPEMVKIIDEINKK